MPNQLTQRLEAYRTYSRVRYNAFYVQDQWTRGRLTMQRRAALRPLVELLPRAADRRPTRVPADAVSRSPRRKGVIGYNDITPRVGVAYDVFGNGKTAIKFNMGRYLEAAVNGNGNYSALLPTSRIDTTQSRNWTDSNSNCVPDCDLLERRRAEPDGTRWRLSAARGPTPTSARSNPSQPVYDEKILKGWGVRPSRLADRRHAAAGNAAARVDRSRLHAPMAAELHGHRQPGARPRRTSIPSAVIAPLDPRLPGGGGYSITGLYNVKNESSRCRRTTAHLRAGLRNDHADLQRHRHERQRADAQRHAAAGGHEHRVSGDRQLRRPWQAAGADRRILHGERSAAVQSGESVCHVAPGVTTQVHGAGSYTIPKIDVLVGGTFQSAPGEPLAGELDRVERDRARSRSAVRSSGDAPNITVNLLSPDDMPGPRVNQLDLRIGKVLRFGGQRATSRSTSSTR